MDLQSFPDFYKLAEVFHVLVENSLKSIATIALIPKPLINLLNIRQMFDQPEILLRRLEHLSSPSLSVSVHFFLR